MANKSKKSKKIKEKKLYKFIVTILSVCSIVAILKLAPNYIKNDITDKTNLIVNNSNVTKRLKSDIIIENDIVYISEDDIENFFDGTIYYDSKYDQIITTSNTKTAILPINSETININGSNISIYAKAIKKDEKYYIPFSEISKRVYNVETTYVKSTDTVVAVSLDRELIYANSSKNNSVKYKPTSFSKTVDKIKTGDNVTVIKSEDNLKGWIKVTTENGKVGYIKEKSVINKEKIRDDFEVEKQIKGNVSIVWDYFSEYASAPKRSEKISGVNVVSPAFISLKKSGKGDIEENIGNDGISYINWAHSNGYKVWALASNGSMKDTTSEIVNDYKLRESFINNILNTVEKYNLDGINLDFENIYEKDKDYYSRLVIELAPRLREMGKVLSVDVTAPDGSADWSLCFNRNEIGKAADYIVFMAYDQNGISSDKPGTTAGYDWVERNIKKFINQEDVDSNKIILGIPFYTRIWQTDSSNVSKSRVVDMKDTYNKIPKSASVEWLNELRQNYVEYNEDNVKYQIWIEDEKSIQEKLLLVEKYNLIGAAYWEKDRETQDTWGIISQMLNID